MTLQSPRKTFKAIPILFDLSINIICLRNLNESLSDGCPYVTERCEMACLKAALQPCFNVTSHAKLQATSFFLLKST